MRRSPKWRKKLPLGLYLITVARFLDFKVVQGHRYPEKLVNSACYMQQVYVSMRPLLR